MIQDKDVIIIHPGDVVSVELPGRQPGYNPKCSCRVLNRKPKKVGNIVGIVIDLFFFVGLAKGNIQPNQIIEFHPDAVHKIFPEAFQGYHPAFVIEITNGTISSISRTDGDSAPVLFKVQDNDAKASFIYEVDCSNTKLVAGDANSIALNPEETLFDFMMEDDEEVETQRATT